MNPGPLDGIARPRLVVGFEQERPQNPSPQMYFYNLSNDSIEQWTGEKWEGKAYSGAFPQTNSKIPLGPFQAGGSLVAPGRPIGDPPATQPIGGNGCQSFAAVQGAFANAGGTGGGTIPVLNSNTTPGNILLALIVCEGNTVNFPTDVGLQNDVNPGSPPGTPIAGYSTWTVLGKAFTDYSAMNIGGCGGSFNPAGNTCTAGLLVAWAYRVVAPGETTTSPVAVSGNVAAGSLTACWLWELPPSCIPSLSSVITSSHAASLPFNAQFTTDPKNVVGAFAFVNTDSGSEASTAIPLNGSAQVQSCTRKDNNPRTSTSSGGWSSWVWVGERQAGGVVGVNYAPLTPTYTSDNYCGVAINFPVNIVLPTIPYPTDAL